MKNMGLTRLTLVAPLEYPAPEATWRAASAVDVMENARVVETLEEAIADCQFVVGTSARERRIPGRCKTPAVAQSGLPSTPTLSEWRFFSAVKIAGC